MQKILVGLLALLYINVATAQDIKNSTKEQLIIDLHHIGAIQFGSFTLKNGSQSPIYIDLRLIISHPNIMKKVAHCLWKKMQPLTFDRICGIPYAGIPIAISVGLLYDLPCIIPREKIKSHGTKRAIEGIYKKGEHVLLIDDLITNGLSKVDIKPLHDAELYVTDVVVLIDREQGGRKNLANKGYCLHSVFTLSDILTTLHQHNKIDLATIKHIKTSLSKVLLMDKAITTKKRLSYKERAQLCSNPVAKKLFNLMEEKQTNLVLAADVTTTQELLALADMVGPEICVLKTHIDTLTDFDWQCIEDLKHLAHKHTFLIFEDRKFADIGNTVKHQYSDGIYHISDWADIVNAHIIPGPSVIQGLKQIGLTKNRGLLLIAQMSSKNSLANPEYVKQAINFAQQHNDFVIGFIAQESITDYPCFIHMTPGIKLHKGTDSLGQQYNTPELAIEKSGTDCIIVGRGIYQDPDPHNAAQRYRKAGWDAYLKRICLN